MENAPDTEKQSDKSKKKAKNLGRVAAKSEHSPREREGSDKPRRSIFSLPESKPTKPVSPESEAPKPKQKAIAEALADTGPASEADAPPEKIGKEIEEPVVLRALAADRLKAIDQQQTPSNAESSEVLGEAAVKQYLENVAFSGSAPEEAFEATMNKLGAEDIDKSSEPARSYLERDSGDLNEMSPEDDTDILAEMPLGGEIKIDRALEAKIVDDTDDDKNNAPQAASDSGGRTGGSGSAGSGGPNTPPPHGPIPPFGAGQGPPGGGSGLIGFNPNLAPNLAPTPMIIERDTPARVERYYEGNPGAALVGGIIGYLIGRRRGRIRTEKKLLPVQKKLEKQVNELNWQLQEREAKIRKAAAEKVRVHGPQVIENFVNSPTTMPISYAESLAAEQRRRAPEASQLHGQKSSEHLGHVLVAAAEAVPTIIAQETVKGDYAGTNEKFQNRMNKNDLEKLASKISDESVKPHSEKRIETLNRAELLGLSEKIIVDGSSLRQIYETHLVGERGLRRLVAEHLRGGDMKKALRREIIEREIDFERDPILRDMAPQVLLASSAGSTRSQTLNKLLKEAAVDADNSNEEAAFFKARAVYEAAQLQQHQKHRQTIDVSLAAAIVLLITLVVFLYITRTN